MVCLLFPRVYLQAASCTSCERVHNLTVGTNVYAQRGDTTVTVPNSLPACPNRKKQI